MIRKKSPFGSKPKTVQSAIGLLITYILSILAYLTSAIVLRYVGVITVVLLVLNFFDIVNYGWFTICLYGFLSAVAAFIINAICLTILAVL